MKKIILLLTIIAISASIYAQPWKSKLPVEKSVDQLTFYDYRKAFNDYWAPFKVVNGYYYENGIKKKAIGWKQFHRWEWDIENQIDVKTGKLPVKTAQQVLDDDMKIKPALKRSVQANWSNLGTNSSDGGYAGIGRLNCIAFHPSDANTFWVGAPSGALWVTKDHGSSWNCLTDNNAVIGVSDIVIPSDYATSKTIYIATGDKDHWDNRSVGVLKSTDGGSTWQTTGLSYSLQNYSMVTRLLPDPANNQTILAATTSGVYKTTDGGATWNYQLTPKSFIDMEYKPGDFNTLYASSLNGGIYVSTNGGIKWSQVLAISEGARTELAVSPANPAIVYALMSGTDNGLYGIYKSTNSGASYTRVFDGNVNGNNLLGWRSDGADSTGQGWYDLSIDVSPANADVVLVGGVNTWRSTDGGSNWEIINHWWGDGVQAVHADKHMIRFRSNGDVFECNDGGIYFSDNNGSDFTDITNGMVTSQMYKLGVSQTVADDVITGLQDNGTKSLANGLWNDVLGGDGMECLIDYTDENIQYGSVYYGDLHRTNDHWQTSTPIKPKNAGDGAWITPFVIDPVDHNTLYAGFTEVWKTTDQGDTWNQISQLNPSDKLRSMAISPVNNNFICVAPGTKIWKTTNGGTNWTDITGNLPVSSANITSIEIKNDNTNTVWVTMGGYATPGVYESVHADTIWTDISAGLPPIPVYSLVQNRQENFAVSLYAGTESGVYIKSDSDNWVGFNTNLPNVKIGELDIFYDKNNPSKSSLMAATYGRGLWKSSMPFRYLPMTFISLTAEQNNISSVEAGSAHAEVIRFRVETENTLKPLNLSQIDLTMNGTTDVNDVAGIRIFSTGNDSLFNAVNQYGNYTSPLTGTISINGNQTLLPGSNYFWIAYDLQSTAEKGHFIDATLNSVMIDSIRLPQQTDPQGRRIISGKYCQAGSVAVDSEYISAVIMGNVNMTSGRGKNGYEDHTSFLSTLEMKKPDSITIRVEQPAVTDELIIWADWNMDGDFNDSSEKAYSSGVAGLAVYIATVAPPDFAVEGITRMRIRLNNTAKDTSINAPCGNSGYGEVEDYSVQVNHPSNVLQNDFTGGIEISPNPVKEELIIKYPGKTSYKIKIINSLGIKMTEQSNLRTNRLIINTKNYPKGIYYLILINDKTRLNSKFIKL